MFPLPTPELNLTQRTVLFDSRGMASFLGPGGGGPTPGFFDSSFLWVPHPCVGVPPTALVWIPTCSLFRVETGKSGVSPLRCGVCGKYLHYRTTPLHVSFLAPALLSARRVPRHDLRGLTRRHVTSLPPHSSLFFPASMPMLHILSISLILRPSTRSRPNASALQTQPHSIATFLCTFRSIVSSFSRFLFSICIPNILIAQTYGYFNTKLVSHYIIFIRVPIQFSSYRRRTTVSSPVLSFSEFPADMFTRWLFFFWNDVMDSFVPPNGTPPFVSLFMRPSGPSGTVSWHVGKHRRRRKEESFLICGDVGNGWRGRW